MKTNTNEIYSKILKARETPNTFDILLAKELCDAIGVPEAYKALSKEQKDIIVIGVEHETDCNITIPTVLYQLYEKICNNQE